LPKLRSNVPVWLKEDKLNDARKNVDSTVNLINYFLKVYGHRLITQYYKITNKAEDKYKIFYTHC